MGTAYLTRRVAFAAAHRYYRDDWSAERNRAVFGACANEHGHGHNYAMEATVEGMIDPETGFVVDLGSLDDVLRREIVVPLDHHHLNHDVPAFGPGGLIPTTENILAWAWPRIAERLPPGVRLHRLRLHEDHALFADYFGGSAGAPQ
ncbi:MAG TPA: 6-carboxytetrahydropterin synthase [Longimicrobiales bacterium]|nr:6-carboxytetrahydropterin synthase [Longimicrobiales bacterium]